MYIYIQSTHDKTPLIFYRKLWFYIENGGESKH